MKGIYGLGVALALGIAGALFNYVYLTSKLKDIEKVAFIGIPENVVIQRGEKIREEHLVPIEIPKAWVGSLADVADRWELRNTVVVNKPVTRTLAGQRILLRDDYRPAPEEVLVLGEGEKARFVAVDTRTFVPALLSPGDRVSFIVPKYIGPQPARTVAPTPSENDGDLDPIAAAAPKPAGSDDVIGPFTVLAVGNRLASAEVWRANRIPQTQENVLTIRVSKNVPNEVQRADELFRRLQAIEYRPVGIEIEKQSRPQTAP